MSKAKTGLYLTLFVVGVMSSLISVANLVSLSSETSAVPTTTTTTTTTTTANPASSSSSFKSEIANMSPEQRAVRYNMLVNEIVDLCFKLKDRMCDEQILDTEKQCATKTFLEVCSNGRLTEYKNMRNLF